MQDLSALTPPLLIAATVVLAIVAFLRHEMRRAGQRREDPPDAISSRDQFEDHDVDNDADKHGSSSAADRR